MLDTVLMSTTFCGTSAAEVQRRLWDRTLNSPCLLQYLMHHIQGAIWRDWGAIGRREHILSRRPFQILRKKCPESDGECKNPHLGMVWLLRDCENEEDNGKMGRVAPPLFLNVHFETVRSLGAQVRNLMKPGLSEWRACKAVCFGKAYWRTTHHPNVLRQSRAKDSYRGDTTAS